MPRGYVVEQFGDAFARYLPPWDPQQAQQVNNEAENSPSPICNATAPVADTESAEKPHVDRFVAVVADETGGIDDDERLIERLAIESDGAA